MRQPENFRWDWVLGGRLVTWIQPVVRVPDDMTDMALSPGACD